MRRAQANRRTRREAIRLYLHVRSKRHKRLMHRAKVNLHGWQDYSHIVSSVAAVGGGQYTDWCASVAEDRYRDAIKYVLECDCPKSVWPEVAQRWIAPPRY